MSHKSRRDPRREQLWREAVAAWRKSGKSIRAFCSDRRLSEASFYSWRRIIGERDQEPTTTRRRLALVPLRIVAEPVVEVLLSAGVVVRVPAGADVAAVATLVAALRSTSC